MTLQNETIPNIGETIEVGAYQMRVVVKKRQKVLKINVKPISTEDLDEDFSE